MAEIVIDNVSKRYENGFNALHNVLSLIHI